MILKEWWYGKTIGRDSMGGEIKKYYKSGKLARTLWRKHFSVYWTYWVGWFIAVLIAFLISKR
jgi:hypothetical protein